MSDSESIDLKKLKNFFANRSKENKEEKDEMLSVIGPHLENIDNSGLKEEFKIQKKKELIDLGRFIKLLDRSYFIVEMKERNSVFILQNKKQKIKGALVYSSKKGWESQEYLGLEWLLIVTNKPLDTEREELKKSSFNQVFILHTEKNILEKL